MANGIPAEIQQFIVQQIDSLAQLESLLLLRRDPQRQWSAADVAKALYTAPETCAAQLADLARRGYLELAPGTEMRYRYRPSKEDVDRLVGEVATLYEERRVAVITLIYSKPVNKVQTFADAFRLKREP